MQETHALRVQLLGWEDPLKEEMAIHSNQYYCLENPTERGAWQATVNGVAKESDTTEQEHKDPVCPGSPHTRTSVGACETLHAHVLNHSVVSDPLLAHGL